MRTRTRLVSTLWSAVVCISALECAHRSIGSNVTRASTATPRLVNPPLQITMTDTAGIVVGVVRDNTDGRPLEGVLVNDYPPLAARQVQTDASGRFRLTSLTPGNHRIQVR